MKLYFDTSAIAKYFHTESGSSEIINLIDDRANEVWISELAITEMLSAFFRKYRMGEINDNTLTNAINAFENKVGIWEIEPISILQTEEANRINTEYGKNAGIRTLDALHLAAFNLLKQNDWAFVIADQQLNTIAVSDGTKTIFIQ